MNKPFVVRSTQKRLFGGLICILNQTPKNTSYVLGFVRDKPFVVRINLLSYEVHKSVYLAG